MRFLTTILVGGILSVSGYQSVFAAPVTYEGHSYEYISEPVSWETAKKLAEDAGGYLACFETREELEFIQTNQSRRLTSWVGLTDAESEGRWKWINGADLDPSMISLLERGRDLDNRDYGHSLLQGGLGSRAEDGSLPRGWRGASEVQGYLIEWDTPASETTSTLAAEVLGAAIEGDTPASEATSTLAAEVLGAALWVDSQTSPQGPRVAFVSDRDGNPEIYTIDSDGSDLRRLTMHPGVDRAPAWSPDGQGLAFVSDRLGQAGLFLMDVRTGEVTPLLELQVPDQSFAFSSMAWSPDGASLAYSIEETAEREIFVEVLSLETGTTRRLQQGMVPSWSPDGARIAFNGGQFPQIAVMSSEGGEPELLLTKPEGAFSVDLLPAWSPDGLNILFTSTRATTEEDLREGRMNYEVYVQGIDDDDGVRLTNSPGRDQAYGWSPDGAQFVFITDRDGNNEVYIGDTDGGEPRNLTRDPGSDAEPSWGNVSVGR